MPTVAFRHRILVFLALAGWALAAWALAAWAGPAGAADPSPSGIHFCTGTVVSSGGLGPDRVENKAETSVLLDVENGRIVLIGGDAAGAFDILRTSRDGADTVYHFGGIAGNIVFKGTYATPGLRLEVRGADRPLRIEISMNCDATAPLRLF